MMNTNHTDPATEAVQPYRAPRHAAKYEHICPKCIRPGDLIDVLGSTVYVEKADPYPPPAMVPAGQTWAVPSDRPPHEHIGIPLCESSFCPYEPVPGSVLPCGCHIQRG